MPQKILLCGWRRDIDDMIVASSFGKPLIFSFLRLDAAGVERKRLYCSKVCRKDIIMWFETRHGRYDYDYFIFYNEGSSPFSLFQSFASSSKIPCNRRLHFNFKEKPERFCLFSPEPKKIISKRPPMVNQVRRGSFSQGSWIGEMQQASDKSVIISEILDPRTKNLLCTSKISDYVLSNELVSMALAMVVEGQQINDVLEELFAEEVFFCEILKGKGNELQIRQADLYLSEGKELSFYEVLLRARQRREIAIGYRAANAERAVINLPAKIKRRRSQIKEYAVKTINPAAKSERRRWSLKDAFVVTAEKE
ncbi:hypothetical protein DKX38_029775 [Salix brachista]|uniref:Uncharacterized protein n=1 Tax=Salix brachista TaxID=2182728 RepID=A0A5N5JC92_9ROSI|nr:hypothetical protein DKX38_029775 [Salix brachista]